MIFWGVAETAGTPALIVVMILLAGSVNREQLREHVVWQYLTRVSKS